MNDLLLIAKCLAEAEARIAKLEKQTPASRVEQLLRAELKKLAADYAALRKDTTDNEATRHAFAVRAEDIKATFSTQLAEIHEAIKKKEYAAAQGFNPRGKWESGATYSRFDLVEVNGSSYVAIVDKPDGKPKRNATQWMLVAARGGGGGVVVTTKADVGLDQVDNTSDANKPVSTAQAAADTAATNSAVATAAADATAKVLVETNRATAAELLKAPHPRVVAFDGDSMMESYIGNAGVANTIPSLLMASANWLNRGSPTNMAVASGTLAEIYTNRTSLANRLVVTEGNGWIFRLAGYNDINAGTSLATLQTYETALANDEVARGFKNCRLTIPLSSGLSAAEELVRDAFNAWLLDNEGVLFDVVIDTSGVTDFTDGVHWSPAGNAAVVALINAAIGSPWDAQFLPPTRWSGTSEGTSLSAYTPALSLRTVPAALATPAAGVGRAADTNAPNYRYLDFDGTPVFPFPFPIGNGVRCGDGDVSVDVRLTSEISCAGDFTVEGWVEVDQRVFDSGSNSGIIIGKDSNPYIGIAGGTGKLFFFDGSNSYNFSDIPSFRVGLPSHFWVRRSGRILKAAINGVPSKPLINNPSPDALTTFVFSRLFSRATGTFFKGVCYGLKVYTAALSNKRLDYLMRQRSADLSGGATCALWMDFEEGLGYQAFDKTTNKNHAKFPTGTAWYWMTPNRRFGTIRETLTFSGSGNIQILGQTATNTDAVVSEMIVHASGSATITVGTASGGAQIAASQAVVSGLNKLVLTAAPAVTTGNLWVGSNAAVTLKVVCAYMRADT